jgi:hypothetical protein
MISGGIFEGENISYTLSNIVLSNKFLITMIYQDMGIAKA